jgi:hypothetical protein
VDGSWKLNLAKTVGADGKAYDDTLVYDRQ